MLSAAECDAWRGVGSPRATGAESDSARSRSAPVRPSGHRSLPYTAVPTTTSVPLIPVSTVPTTTSSVPRRKKLKVTTCWSEKENCGSSEATDGRAPSELNPERETADELPSLKTQMSLSEKICALGCVGSRWVA